MKTRISVNAIKVKLLRDTFVSRKPYLKGEVIEVDLNMFNYLFQINAAREFIETEQVKVEEKAKAKK